MYENEHSFVKTVRNKEKPSIIEVKIDYPKVNSTLEGQILCPFCSANVGFVREESECVILKCVRCGIFPVHKDLNLHL